jgi:hypothetical protein
MIRGAPVPLAERGAAGEEWASQMTRAAARILSLGITLALAPSSQVAAQERITENTLKLAPGQSSPAATIADMAWLAGHWTGDGLGGRSEEIWSPPEHGVMMGMYRHIQDDKPVFYEFLTLAEERGSLVLRLKHFHPDLTGWEEKDKHVSFPFVAKRGGVIHFEGMSFQPQGDALTVYLAIENKKDGSVREAVFRYTRARKTP